MTRAGRALLTVFLVVGTPAAALRPGQNAFGESRSLPLHTAPAVHNGGSTLPGSAARHLHTSSLPVAFELNRGQAAADVAFIAHAGEYTLYLGSGAATYVLTHHPRLAPDRWRCHCLSRSDHHRPPRLFPGPCATPSTRWLSSLAPPRAPHR